MNMIRLKKNTKADIVDQASRWFVKLRSRPITKQIDGDFLEWLEFDSTHETAYERCEYIVALGRELEYDSDLQPEITTCRRLADSRTTGQKSSSKILTGGIFGGRLFYAVPVIALLSVVLFIYLSSLPRTYSTEIGERRTVILEDDSTITLNTNTLLTVNYSPDERLINLKRGEAYFEVESDPARPFHVKAGNGMVTAVGTAFDVSIDGDKVTVSVLEGSVAVEPMHVADADPAPVRKSLGADESVNYWSAGVLTETKSIDKQRINAWREGKLNFDDLSLADAIKEHNRYTKRKIILGSDDIRNLSISGVFHIGDTESFLYLLQESLGLKSIRRNNLIFLVRPSRSRMAEPVEKEKLPGSSG